MEQKEMNITKTKVFNVIILDRSGSMECIRQAAVEGFAFLYHNSLIFFFQVLRLEKRR